MKTDTKRLSRREIRRRDKRKRAIIEFAIFASFVLSLAIIATGGAIIGA